jgi:hypothetical protein
MEALMGVVTKYGTGYKDPAASKMVEAVYAEGSERSINSQIAIANGDSATSVYYVGRLPSSAIIDPRSMGYHAAIAGVTDFSLGFAGAVKALMSSVDTHSGGAISATSGVANADLNKRAWQLAGLSSDPGGMLDIFATLGANASGAGVVTFKIGYSKTA